MQFPGNIPNAKKKKADVLVVYIPPPGTPFIKKEGKYVLSVPVYDQDSAKQACDKIMEKLVTYLKEGGMWESKISIEKLFLLNDCLKDVYNLINDEEKDSN